MQGGLQTGWSRVTLTGMTSLYPTWSLILVCMVTVQGSKKAGTRMQDFLRVRLESGAASLLPYSVDQTKLQDQPKFKAPSFGYREENNHGQCCRQSSMASIS